MEWLTLIIGIVIGGIFGIIGTIIMSDYADAIFDCSDCDEDCYPL
jgi:hypothetical protein